jgi:hypothetical protein
MRQLSARAAMSTHRRLWPHPPAQRKGGREALKPALPLPLRLDDHRLLHEGPKSLRTSLDRDTSAFATSQRIPRSPEWQDES